MAAALTGCGSCRTPQRGGAAAAGMWIPIGDRSARRHPSCPRDDRIHVRQAEHQTRDSTRGRRSRTGHDPAARMGVDLLREDLAECDIALEDAEFRSGEAAGSTSNCCAADRAKYVRHARSGGRRPSRRKRSDQRWRAPPALPGAGSAAGGHSVLDVQIVISRTWYFGLRRHVAERQLAPPPLVQQRPCRVDQTAALHGSAQTRRAPTLAQQRHGWRAIAAAPAGAGTDCRGGAL